MRSGAVFCCSMVVGAEWSAAVLERITILLLPRSRVGSEVEQLGSGIVVLLQYILSVPSLPWSSKTLLRSKIAALNSAPAPMKQQDTAPLRNLSAPSHPWSNGCSGAKCSCSTFLLRTTWLNNPTLCEPCLPTTGRADNKRPKATSQ